MEDGELLLDQAVAVGAGTSRHRELLLFQMDSIICSSSERSVDDFLEWDFIGAPVNPFLGHGYNGGLSIRNPKMILDILAGPSNDFDELWRTNQTGLYIEDQFYYNKMRSSLTQSFRRPRWRSCFRSSRFGTIARLASMHHGFGTPTVWTKFGNTAPRLSW